MLRTEMKDVELARLRLKEKGLSLVVVKDGKVIFETEAHGIKGFLEAIKLLDKELAGSSVADKNVGRAVALLCVYFQVSAMLAVIISTEGIKVLKDNNIPYQFERCVPNILNQRRNDICPSKNLLSHSQLLKSIQKTPKSPTITAMNLDLNAHNI